MNTGTEKKAKRARRQHSAKEKGTALLAVWSGRRRMARVCKELGISWALFNSWEKRAVCGIRESLEEAPGQVKAEPPGQVRLGARLESLLGGSMKTAPAMEKLAETELEN